MIAPTMSTATEGADMISSMPMKVESAFRCAPTTTLAISFNVAQCASVKPLGNPGSGPPVTIPRRRAAVSPGKTCIILPVISPSTFITTAATTSSGSPTMRSTSSSGVMYTSGTPMWMTRFVISESAVAAWAAPMLASSRSASSWTLSRERRSISTSEYGQRIEHERGPTVRQQCRSGKIRQHPVNGIDSLDKNLFAPDQLIEGERGAAATDVGDDGGLLFTVRDDIEQPAHAHEGYRFRAQVQ